VDEDTLDQADVRLSYSAFFPSGVTQQQFNDLTREIIGSAFDFWKWASLEHEL
jgi:hypothetical protein